ncbi:MAG TPA: hypothetical protein PKO24_00615 [Methanomassiliicoccales archaeon]|jgi:hypothetical protein|nr:hypothetical protein [Methanomassiliicoccales archaeon]MCE5260665.1 hypothetical protein [Euryarchaeota archaeon]HOE52117.1 hypothetical protein [Methanomassiliicoccales archaeon]HOO03655.1 hypothetical protein [Methanomassiliicoccales archaeon]HPD08520.1 hypothetical protein [Methanomassiliicoccales archaeon]
MDWIGFLTVLLLTFSLVMLLAGAFTAYFGSGKSRMIGVVLLVIGLIVGLLWAYLGYADELITVDLSEVIWVAFVNILAALIGALVAVGAFLLAIMKS